MTGKQVLVPILGVRMIWVYQMQKDKLIILVSDITYNRTS